MFPFFVGKRVDENQAFRRRDFRHKRICPISCRRPDSSCCSEKTPFARKSSLTTSMALPFGPHHCANRSASVHAFHTNSRGASSTRLITNSLIVCCFCAHRFSSDYATKVNEATYSSNLSSDWRAPLSRPDCNCPSRASVVSCRVVFGQECSAVALFQNHCDKRWVLRHQFINEGVRQTPVR